MNDIAFVQSGHSIQQLLEEGDRLLFRNVFVAYEILSHVAVGTVLHDYDTVRVGFEVVVELHNIHIVNLFHQIVLIFHKVLKKWMAHYELLFV